MVTSMDERPATDDRDVAGLVPAAVDEVVEAARWWLGWDGRPALHDGNMWTPHKSLRRVADHLLDHLAEVDLDEAISRLTRLAVCYRARLAGLDTRTLDARPADEGWSIREVVHHVAGVTYYADAMEARFPPS